MGELGVEEPLHDVDAIVRGPIADRLERELEVAVQGAVDVVLDLLEQRRHQIESLMDARVLAQDGHHVEVVLDPVQPYPRHEVPAGQPIFIERLVHVPNEGYVEH